MISFITVLLVVTASGMMDDTMMPTNPMAYTGFIPYVTPFYVPEVLDLRNGTNIEMVIGATNHVWGGGLVATGSVYGYAVNGNEPVYPGPTILVKEDVSINVTWYNNLSSPHILSDYVAEFLLSGPSACYPSCGVPAITHVHGLEVTASSDGSPMDTFSKGESRQDHYPNTQLGATLFYHDHGYGLTRLNVWAGLVGAYLIEGSNEEALNVTSTCDIPLIIQDKLIAENGSLLYSTTAMCVVEDLLPWVMEAYGNVNLVNGKVAPYLEIPRQQCRFRIVNGANSRAFFLDIPFYDVCQVIGTDSGLVKHPQQMQSSMDITLYPAERIELMCDFSNTELGTVYNMTNANPINAGMMEIMQFRVNLPATQEYKQLPSILNNITDLQWMWENTENAITKNITMGQFLNSNSCATELIVMENGKYMNLSAGDTIHSTKGVVEKWNFMNPTADVHPFHIHVVHMQCGSTNETIDSNSLKDDIPIPIANSSNGIALESQITKICYIAMMPSKSLIWNSTTGPADFGFSTNESYVAHCHILEHEDNDMMSWFALDDATIDNNSDSSNSDYQLLYLLFLLLFIPLGVLGYFGYMYFGKKGGSGDKEILIP
jgi:FtsP/CotA-like multicopper oxidase with cupredoxin domain